MFGIEGCSQVAEGTLPAEDGRRRRPPAGPALFRTTADLKPASRRTCRKLFDNQILPGVRAGHPWRDRRAGGT
jgi:hypothetical protein